MTKKILIMAGGTGGHVFPGLAVAQNLLEKGWQIRWLGTKERMESKLVPQHGFDISYINISGVRRNGLLRMLIAPFKIIKAIFEANKVINEFKPDVVLGLGGYASGPGGIAAWLKGIPLVLHEQNAVPGMTNKILSNFAKTICTGFPGAFKSQKSTVIGNPVRTEILALSDLPIESIRNRNLRILVVGGSLGAKVFNEELPKLFSLYSNLDVRHQTGRGNYESTCKIYDDLKIQDRVQVLEFINDMADAYIWADVVICRAGALTVAEIAAAHKAAIFIPLPSAVDDHQTKNALSLVNANAAKIVPQSQISSGKLKNVLDEMVQTPEIVEEMSRCAHNVAILDATENLSKICEQLANVD